MKLSIVIMMKNEEKYLEKTLSSLENLRKEISSELVILDTGSTDSSVEIAKKYTDKIYFEQWNDNFSDMRNKSISYASGEWLLILDADEPIIDYDRLIDFFNTKKHKKYNCATIEIVNIQSLNPIKKAIGQVPRFFRNVKEFKYRGIIHEQPLLIPPVYTNIVTCEHYGYLYQDKNLQKKKLDRNIVLLEKQLQKEPNNAYIAAHLANSHVQKRNQKDALIYAKKSYELIKQTDDKGRSTKYSHHYASYILALLLNSKIKLAYDICLEYMSFDDKNIDVLFNLGYLSLLLQKFEESIKYLNKYLYYIENYKESSQYNCIYMSTEYFDKKDEACKYVIESYYKLEKYEEILEFIKNTEFDNSSAYYQIIEALYNKEGITSIVKFYKDISLEVNKQKFRNSIESGINNIFKKEDLKCLYKELSNIEDDYGIFNKYRHDKIYNNELENILINNNEAFYSQIIEIYLAENKKLPEYLNIINDEKLEVIFIYLIKNNYEFKFILKEYILNAENTLDLNNIRIYKIITKSLLFNADLIENEYNEIFNLYYMYNKYFIDFINKLNNKNDKEILPFKSYEEVFIEEFENTNKLKDEPLKYIKKLKQLALNFTNYKTAIEYLIEILKKDINTSSEVKNLKQNFIEHISSILSVENLNQIQNFVDEYVKLYGKDYQILNIEGILSILNNDLKKAEIHFKKSLSLDIYNCDTLYNIGYLKELKQEFKEANKFYRLCRHVTNDSELISLCDEKINIFDNI